MAPLLSKGTTSQQNEYPPNVIHTLLSPTQDICEGDFISIRRNQRSEPSSKVKSFFLPSSFRSFINVLKNNGSQSANIQTIQQQQIQTQNFMGQPQESRQDSSEHRFIESTDPYTIQRDTKLTAPTTNKTFYHSPHSAFEQSKKAKSSESTSKLTPFSMNDDDSKRNTIQNSTLSKSEQKQQQQKQQQQFSENDCENKYHFQPIHEVSEPIVCSVVEKITPIVTIGNIFNRKPLMPTTIEQVNNSTLSRRHPIPIPTITCRHSSAGSDASSITFERSIIGTNRITSLQARRILESQTTKTTKRPSPLQKKVETTIQTPSYRMNRSISLETKNSNYKKSTSYRTSTPIISTTPSYTRNDINRSITQSITEEKNILRTVEPTNTISENTLLQPQSKVVTKPVVPNAVATAVTATTPTNTTTRGRRFRQDELVGFPITEIEIRRSSSSSSTVSSLPFHGGGDYYRESLLQHDQIRETNKALNNNSNNNNDVSQNNNNNNNNIPSKSAINDIEWDEVINESVLQEINYVGDSGEKVVSSIKNLLSTSLDLGSNISNGLETTDHHMSYETSLLLSQETSKELNHILGGDEIKSVVQTNSTNDAHQLNNNLITMKSRAKPETSFTPNTLSSQNKFIGNSSSTSPTATSSTRSNNTPQQIQTNYDIDDELSWILNDDSKPPPIKEIIIPVTHQYGYGWYTKEVWKFESRAVEMKNERVRYLAKRARSNKTIKNSPKASSKRSFAGVRAALVPPSQIVTERLKQ